MCVMKPASKATRAAPESVPPQFSHGLMEIRKLFGLCVDRLCHFVAPVADIDAIEPGEAVDQLPSFPVTNTDALPAFHDARISQRARGICLEWRERMKDCLRSRSSSEGLRRVE